jgi:Flp pilus assembly protein protease CpaA
MQYLLYFSSIPFLYLNYKIIISDLKEKKIPNKYLLYLLILIPFYYWLLFFSGIMIDVDIFLFIWHIVLAFLLSFLLYYYWIWSAWDAKYLLVLWFYIPHIWIIPFIWNISIITLIYIFLYIFYFYVIKNIIDKSYRKKLLNIIKYDLYKYYNTYKENKISKNLHIIFKGTVIFLLIFISIRLSKIYLFKYIFTWGDSNIFISISKSIEINNIYLISILTIIVIWLFYLYRILKNKIVNYIHNNYGLYNGNIWNILLIILSAILLVFVVYQYINNPYEIKNYLFKILTLYISLYILIKIIIYSYGITFWNDDEEFINIKKLKLWDLVDKKYLIKSFIEQITLLSNKDKYLSFDELKLSNIKNDLNNIETPIDRDSLIIINNTYNAINNIENITDYNIKILKTFSFWPYIFLWFIITVLFANKIIIYLIECIIKNI